MQISGYLYWKVAITIHNLLPFQVPNAQSLPTFLRPCSPTSFLRILPDGLTWSRDHHRIGSFPLFTIAMRVHEEINSNESRLRLTHQRGDWAHVPSLASQLGHRSNLPLGLSNICISPAKDRRNLEKTFKRSNINVTGVFVGRCLRRSGFSEPGH